MRERKLATDIFYPKIDTLYKRDDDFVVTDELRIPEFALPRSWVITEKIDGTNIRVCINSDGITFGGRTAAAVVPRQITELLSETFLGPENEAVIENVFHLTDWPDTQVVIFGEGYGGNIQAAAKDYGSAFRFRVFDININGMWLNWSDVKHLASSLGIQTVPTLATWAPTLPKSERDLHNIIADSAQSLISVTEGRGFRVPEGIVARTDPELKTRIDQRLMWKLKFCDFVAKGRK